MTQKEITLTRDLDAAPLDAEIVDDPAPARRDITRDWVDWCTGRGIKLPTVTIKRIGRGVKDLRQDGIPDPVIRKALAAMTDDRVISRPALLAAYVLRVQQGPELPPERMTQRGAAALRSMTPESAQALAGSLGYPTGHERPPAAITAGPCPHHPGQSATTCGPCRSERIGS